MLRKNENENLCVQALVIIKDSNAVTKTALFVREHVRTAVETLPRGTQYPSLTFAVGREAGGVGRTGDWSRRRTDPVWRRRSLSHFKGE